MKKRWQVATGNKMKLKSGGGKDGSLGHFNDLR